VEHATDEQFETWRTQNGIPAKSGAWSFERRCKAINMCRFYGAWSALKFPLELGAKPEQVAPNSAEVAPNSAEGESFMQECQRCGEKAELQTVETKDHQQQAQICAPCVDLVIRPNTAWQIKQLP
jgi:hypothetical protein